LTVGLKIDEILAGMVRSPLHTERKDGYLPGLDGWRAIAILSVMLYHSILHRAGIFSTGWAWTYGYHGVDIFFAISGLLITTRLLREEKATGTISLRHFYLRRAFRILPAALAYLLAIAALSYMRWIHVSAAEWFASLFFYRNYSFLYLGACCWYPWFTTHFWSLSLEEHFYLLLPAILLFTRLRLRIATLVLISGAVIAHRYFALLHREWFSVWFHTDVRLDALMIPALLAVLSQSDRYGKGLQVFLKQWLWVLMIALICVVRWAGESAFQATAVAVLMPCVVLGTVLQPASVTTRILEWAPLRWIGRISYSLYLWQQLFFTQRFYLWRPLGRAEAWPLNVCLTLLVATLSYYAVERPLVRLGHRLTGKAPRSTGSAGALPMQHAAGKLANLQS
jgi:peptidoglycan/LPS O-acetylase OafA/YrhL